MYPNPNLPRKQDKEESSEVSARGRIGEILQYTPPMLRELPSGWYIEFYAFDPVYRGLRRKRIRIPQIKGKQVRRNYAKSVIQRLTIKLVQGWNPWISGNDIDALTLEDALSRYERHNEKMLASGYIRKETYDGYKSNIKIMRKYISEKRPIYYAYQFNREFCVDFLDYIFIDRDNGAQTRNNYLNFLRVLSGFLVEKGFLTSRPTDGIAPISKRLYQKQRQTIPEETLKRISEWMRDHDPHFLFASQLLYYCFIRPVEMTRLKISDFNLKAGTVTIHADQSKNKRTQTITVPKKVLLYGIDLGIFSRPTNYYVFGDELRPGPVATTTRVMRGHWAKVRKALKLKACHTFYSLKDTGITEMFNNNMASNTVKEQARHSSLLITEIYLEKRQSARPEIIDYDGAF